jgi:hypothetical protein
MTGGLRLNDRWIASLRQVGCVFKAGGLRLYDRWVASLRQVGYVGWSVYPPHLYFLESPNAL